VQSEKCTVQNCIVFTLISLATCYLLLATYNAEAAPAIAAGELLKNAQRYDARTIIYQGEVIGDMMLRGDFAWMNVWDKTAAIGVFCPQELIGEIEYKGSYRFRGDIISVQGVFHRFCSEHGGDTDIHAEKITLIQRGEELAYPLGPQKIRLSIILPAVAFILVIIYTVIRRFR
jgi:hypothetical protein